MCGRGVRKGPACCPTAPVPGGQRYAHAPCARLGSGAECWEEEFAPGGLGGKVGQEGEAQGLGAKGKAPPLWARVGQKVLDRGGHGKALALGRGRGPGLQAPHKRSAQHSAQNRVLPSKHLIRAPPAAVVHKINDRAKAGSAIVSAAVGVGARLQRREPRNLKHQVRIECGSHCSARGEGGAAGP